MTAWSDWRVVLIPAMLLLSYAGFAAAGNNTDPRHEQGRAIYNYRCYFCHGYSGDARTLTNTYLAVPPRDFTTTPPEQLDRRAMLDAVTSGRPETAMTGFSRLLNKSEIEAVVDFVRREFMTDKLPNTRYHTQANGWPDHDRYRDAFPFARGDIPLDGDWEDLSASQQAGKRLFMSSCISCHDRARVLDEGPVWESRSLSYPRNNFSYSEIDAVSSASVYAMHDVPPVVDDLSEQARLGEQVYQQNCAFCHAADGTGKNWIGSFLEPKPRDLTNPEFMSYLGAEDLRRAIEQGLPGTSMPAWRDVLSSAQIDSLVSYIAAVFHPLARSQQDEP